ncbi:MAG: diacylglycerol kinase family lipid kinase [Clostridia bacterium]|nr:diacylglycerol kinase family lipid kinase [Clostridia bacterium]
MEKNSETAPSGIFSEQHGKTNPYPYPAPSPSPASDPEGRRRLAFIVNPTAGSGKCAERFEKVEAFFAKKGVPFEVFYTRAAGHAEELAARCVRDGYETIVSVGGDGTLRETASALAGTNAVLGVLPFGTGNDFASVLRIPENDEAAAELLISGEAKPTDLGMANSRLFANVCGIGFDVDVLARTERHKKGRSGMLPYLLGIVDAILHKRRVRCRITLDGGEELVKDALLVDICNGRRFGGGMLVAPGAEPDDGLFDVCIADYLGFFRILTLLPSFIKGRHINNRRVIYTSASSVRVVTDEENIVQLDGELIESTPLECRLLPGAVRILRP